MSNPTKGKKPIALDPGREIWDQQPKESARQHERFIRYRNLGRMRSLTTVNKLLTELGDPLTYATIRTQSYLYRWVERAQAWDKHQDEADHDRTLQARREMIDRHQKVASALLTKALTALRATTTDQLDPADIVRMIKLATDLEVRALGEPSQTISLTGPAGGPIQTEDLTALSPTERQIRLRELATELARRAGLATVAMEEEE